MDYKAVTIFAFGLGKEINNPTGRGSGSVILWMLPCDFGQMDRERTDLGLHLVGGVEVKHVKGIDCSDYGRNVC